jgi:hypothetical protein
MKIRNWNLGRNVAGDRVWVNIELAEKENRQLHLSFQGEIAMKGSKRDGPGSSFGQIDIADLPNTPLARRIGEVWERWHLNDMRAGCEHQRALGWSRYEDHPSEPCPVCGYEYGSAWLYEPLPDEIVAEVESWAALAAKDGEADVRQS